MKKKIAIACFSSVLFACNDHAGHKTAAGSEKNTDHATHSMSENKSTDMNEITSTMKEMVHEMHAAEPSGNPDIDFSIMMIAHHKGAVKMSEVAIRKGKNADIKAFAQKVVTVQNEEISHMETLVAKSDPSVSSRSRAFQDALNNSMVAMMHDSTPIYNDIDKDFAAQMIPHHQSAVDMAKAYLKFGQMPELQKLCRGIITSQSQEIDWLKKWLAANR